MYLVQKYDMRALFLRHLLETGQPIYVDIRGTRKSSLCGAKTVRSFVSYFRTLRAGPAPAGAQRESNPRPSDPASYSGALRARSSELIGAHRSSSQGCQLADSRLKLYWQAKLRSVDSCQNGTCADHYQKTNNVGSGSLRYTIWHFPIHAGRICLTPTRSLLIRIFAILMKVN